MIENGPILTLKLLQGYKPHIIMDTGHYEDGPEGLGMSSRPRDVRWVAVTYPDGLWAVFVAPADWDPWQAARSGDMVKDINKVRLVVPCDDAAAERYMGK